MSELTHLDELEAEAIYIIREVAAECENPVMLYSIGKDSSVMLHLALKAFYPEKPPFPFMHIDTTWKFHDMIKFRDDTAKKLGIEMIVYSNEEGIRNGINPFDHGAAYTDIMKTQALKQALTKYGFTAAFGGGRRDEEKSRAKERIFSFRNEAHAWDPKNQRPEMWKLYTTKINKGESIRVFPISNWTEKDILDKDQMRQLHEFFFDWGTALMPKLVPGANVIVASNPLLSYFVSSTLVSAGLERRGEIIRLTMTMRGGDRPKNAERDFPDVSVMPRSMWEPWLVFRKPLEGRVKDNLRKWGTGGFRRISDERPFGDVIKSAPTNKSERNLANHPSLKPQNFLRQIVRAALPLGKGIVVDPFAGSGSTLAAAEAVGYASKGVERDQNYYELACTAIPKLAKLRTTLDEDTASTVEAS